MGNRDVFDGDALVFAEVPKMVASECSSEVGGNVVRETESMDDIFEELECRDLYSIHLENLSMAMYMYQKLPSVGLKGPIMSSP